MTGNRDYLLRVVAADLSSYEAFLKNKLTRLDGIASIESSFALSQVKYSIGIAGVSVSMLGPYPRCRLRAGPSAPAACVVDGTRRCSVAHQSGSEVWGPASSRTTSGGRAGESAASHSRDMICPSFASRLALLSIEGAGESRVPVAPMGPCKR